MQDLTTFQRDSLYIIAGLGDPHGLAIADELAEYYEKEVHHGRLYPNLDTLVDKGLVEKTEADGRTNTYVLTTRGRRELEARREWENPVYRVGTLRLRWLRRLQRLSIDATVQVVSNALDVDPQNTSLAEDFNRASIAAFSGNFGAGRGTHRGFTFPSVS